MGEHADSPSTLEAEEAEDRSSKPGCTARPCIERRKAKREDGKGKKAEEREEGKIFYKLIT